ncbi:MAG: acetylglutamate kinase [Bacteroidetes bacterium]|nr:acetylglutamate kinase [Bacteroidota bacterium]
MKLFVIKIGGNIIDDEKQLSWFLNDFSSISENKMLVHGGGKIATELSKQLGIEPKMVEGRRITDADTLKIVQMVYGGLINKNIVAQLQARNCNAIGLSGADGNIVLAHKRAPVDLTPNPSPTGEGRKNKVDYGFVGDIEKVNSEKLSALFTSGFSPIIAPLTHDGKGQMLNTNADTMASAISVAMSQQFDTTLIYCFEKSGVLRNMDDENSVIEKINLKEYEKLKTEGVISKGMIPKLDNAFDAIKQGVKSVVICHAKELNKLIKGQDSGTRLV